MVVVRTPNRIPRSIDSGVMDDGSLAKRLGCKRVLALINRRAYAEMIEGGPIDIGISPAQVSIGTLLAHVRPCPRPSGCRLKSPIPPI